MATAKSRGVLDWFRSHAATQFATLGLTQYSNNMNIPLTSDVRLQAALDYLLTVEADIKSQWTPAADALWETSQNTVWDEIYASMPQSVKDDWVDMWTDGDVRVRTLLKVITRVLSYGTTLVAAGG